MFNVLMVQLTSLRFGHIFACAPFLSSTILLYSMFATIGLNRRNLLMSKIGDDSDPPSKFDAFPPYDINPLPTSPHEGYEGVDYVFKINSTRWFPDWF